MSSKINFFYIPYHNLGGHFLIWSVYFLSNQKLHWAHNRLQPVTQVENFKSQKNFHAHQPVTMLFGPRDLELFMSNIGSIDHSCLPLNVYLTNELLSDTVKKTFAVDIHQAGSKKINQCIDLQRTQMGMMIKSLQTMGYPVIFIDCYQQDHLVSFYNDRYVLDWNRNLLPDKNTFLKNAIDIFFSNITDFEDQHIWDQREILALNVGPFIEKHSYSSCIDFSQPNLVYTTDDLWNFFDSCLGQLFQFLKLDIDKSKIPKWELVYQQWRKVHQPSFARDINNIVDSIVNGRYMDLSRYNMTFLHEVLIQHFLIHQKNLNLRNWNLNTFPVNTIDLHRLLEPNFHLLR